ncbi:MAG: hypothetical protein KBA42_06430 [Bacteroidales bacterium]|nr:hypothetical protein [Bacteroidales bacterium]MBP9028567.1 hypothetical protein [Bacteroidales bacterium]NMC99245.1 hypothetical protein [Bacteroidales bacterium]HRR11044.1 hypothetical protein [Tenuifilum sp.]
MRKNYICFLFVLIFVVNIISCNNNKIENTENDLLIYRFNIENKINNFVYLKPNGSELDLNLLPKKSFFLFIPSLCCSQCYSNIYNIINKKLINKSLFIVCDEKYLRKTLFTFPNNNILTVRNLDKFVKVKNSIFIKPFLCFFQNGENKSFIIIEKNEKESITLFIDWWTNN